MHVYIHTYPYIEMYIYIYIYTYILIHRVYAHICTYILIQKIRRDMVIKEIEQIYPCLNTYIYIHMAGLTHTHMYICIYIYVCIYVTKIRDRRKLCR